MLFPGRRDHQVIWAKGNIMVDFISFSIGGIPIVFWASMTAVLLTMFFMARTATDEDIAPQSEETIKVLIER